MVVNTSNKAQTLELYQAFFYQQTDPFYYGILIDLRTCDLFHNQVHNLQFRCVN
jgi:hypothetical protein